MTDLGELAVRLGSIVSYDRRGDVVLMESFEYGLTRWDAASSGAGAATTLSLLNARSGLMSCAMKKGTTSGGKSTLVRNVPIVALSQVGLEFSFVPTNDNHLIEARLLYANGTRTLKFGWRFRIDDDDVQVWNDGGAWETVAIGLPVGLAQRGHSTIKLVADLVGETYVRGLFNAQVVDLSSFTPEDTGAATSAFVQAHVRHEAAVASERILFVDDVIITQNEPP
jgi:hypothetical protein